MGTVCDKSRSFWPMQSFLSQLYIYTGHKYPYRDDTNSSVFKMNELGIPAVDTQHGTATGEYLSFPLSPASRHLHAPPAVGPQRRPLGSGKQHVMAAAQLQPHCSAPMSKSGISRGTRQARRANRGPILHVHNFDARGDVRASDQLQCCQDSSPAQKRG